AQRRARLLAAGREALGSEGSKGTTVRRVCELAGLNPRYFYESFASIDELAVAVFERIVAEAMEAVLEVVARNRDDPEATAREAIRAFVELMTDDPRKGRVAFIEAMGSEVLMRRRLDTLQRFAEVVAAYTRETGGAADDRAELTAQVLVGGLTEVLIAWLDGRLGVSRDTLIEHCAALF